MWYLKIDFSILFQWSCLPVKWKPTPAQQWAMLIWKGKKQTSEMWPMALLQKADYSRKLQKPKEKHSFFLYTLMLLALCLVFRGSGKMQERMDIKKKDQRQPFLSLLFTWNFLNKPNSIWGDCCFSNVISRNPWEASVQSLIRKGIFFFFAFYQRTEISSIFFFCRSALWFGLCPCSHAQECLLIPALRRCEWQKHKYLHTVFIPNSKHFPSLLQQ